MKNITKTLTFLVVMMLSYPALSRNAPVIVGPPGFQSNTFHQAQQMHLQTQQQLQAQDQYRRQLLLQDQQRQLQQLLDQQNQIEFSNRSAIMYQYSDRLKRYSHPANKLPDSSKKAK